MPSRAAVESGSHGHESNIRSGRKVAIAASFKSEDFRRSHSPNQGKNQFGFRLQYSVQLR